MNFLLPDSQRTPRINECHCFGKYCTVNSDVTRSAPNHGQYQVN